MRLITFAAVLSVASGCMSSAHRPPVAYPSRPTPGPCDPAEGASADSSQRQPDLGDAAEGSYFGDVVSDARGSSQSDVTVTVRRVGWNRVRVCSDYRRLPIVELSLTRVGGAIMNSGGDTTFMLDSSKTALDVTFGDVRWAGNKR